MFDTAGETGELHSIRTSKIVQRAAWRAPTESAFSYAT